MLIQSILIGILLIVAGIAKAAMDTLSFHFDNSIFQRFKGHQWIDPNVSWVNKYKYRDRTNGPAFFGSTTFLVFLTDAWHFFQSIMFNCLFLVPVVILYPLTLNIFVYILYLIILFFVTKLIFLGTFELFFSKIFKK